MNLSDVISEMKPKERVRVTFESGAYLDGTVKKIKKQLAPQLTTEVKNIKTTYIPVKFKTELCKETSIFL